MAKQRSSSKVNSCPLCGRERPGEHRVCSECSTTTLCESRPESFKVTVYKGDGGAAQSGFLIRAIFAVVIILALAAGIYWGSSYFKQDTAKVEDRVNTSTDKQPVKTKANNIGPDTRSFKVPAKDAVTVPVKSGNAAAPVAPVTNNRSLVDKTKANTGATNTGKNIVTQPQAGVKDNGLTSKTEIEVGETGNAVDSSTSDTVKNIKAKEGTEAKESTGATDSSKEVNNGPEGL